MSIVSFNQVPLEITGDHPVVESLQRELGPLCPTPLTVAKAKFTIMNGRTAPAEEDSVKVGESVAIGNQEIRLALPSYGCTVDIRTDAAQTLGVKVRCSESGVADSPRQKIRHKLSRLYSRAYFTPMEQTCYSLVGGVIAPVFLCFLQQDRTLLHASAVTYGNKAILFPGWSGVGKTPLSIELINNFSFQFLSDDITFLGSDGMVQMNPRSISVKAYLLEGNARLQEQLVRGRSLVDRLHWSVSQRIRGNHETRRVIPPLGLYGEGSLATEARVERVVFLQRTSRSTFGLTPASPSDLAQRCANIIATEYDAFLYLLRGVHAAGGDGVPSVDGIINNAKGIYEEAFRDCDCMLLNIPEGASPQQLAEFTVDRVIGRIAD